MVVQRLVEQLNLKFVVFFKWLPSSFNVYYHFLSQDDDWGNFKVKNVSANTYELYLMDGVTPLDSTAYTAYTSGGGGYLVYEITTTLSSDIKRIIK